MPVVTWNGSEYIDMRTGLPLEPIPPVPTGYTIFGDAKPATYTTHDDGGEGSWTTSAFYITAAPARQWFIKGVRYYVEPGSPIIGRSAHGSVQRRAVANGGLWLGTGPVANALEASRTPFENPLVAGWNEVRFATAVQMDSLDGVYAGVQVAGGYYQVAGDMGADSVQSIDGVNLYLSEKGGSAGEVVRSRYAPTESAALAYADSPHYGHDIIVSETL